MVQKHDWVIPSSLWGPEGSPNGYRQEEFFRPALFEFATDDFMDEFLAAAAAPTPANLESVRLHPHEGNGSRKLFQPVHGRFYLAAASLCCREPGFPDRQVQQNDGERAGFVLRKLVNDHEFGWVIQGESQGWQELSGTPRALLCGEEQLAVFPIPLSSGRNLFCGYIPTAASETYKAAPATLTVDNKPLDLPVEELGSRFTSPLTHHDPPNPGEPLLPSMVDALPDDVAYTTSVYLLVELWEFLKDHFPDLAAAVENDDASPQFTDDKAAEKLALYAFLNSQSYKGTKTLSDALREVATNYAALNAPGGADLDALGFSLAEHSLKNSTDLDNAALQELLDNVADALPDERPPVELPKLEISSTVHYVLRFVYERPQCDPPITEVSRPSQPFTFAPFFDPDAPARSVRIPLPSDVSIAGMRKFKKNVTFMMSDSMRKKMNSLLGNEKRLLTEDDPQIDEGNGDAFAFICSFSIQIIFMVAFMLLLMFVVVLNFIFWWLPFFRICLPIPKQLLPE